MAVSEQVSRLQALFPDHVLPSACPSRVVLDHVTSKWGVLVLLALTDRTLRWSDLRRAVEGVSEKMLAQSLGELQELGLINKQSDEGPPLRVVYAPTELGATLRPLLSALQEWGVRHQRPPLVPDGESSVEPWEPEPGRWSADQRDEGA